MTKRKLASPVYLAIATALLAAPAFAQAPATPATPPTPAPATSTPAPATPAPAATTPSSAPTQSMQGMPHTGAKPSAATRSARIEKLQTALNANGAQLTVDGKMGAQTKSALMDFQKSKGLKVTGKVDKETIAALKPAG